MERADYLLIGGGLASARAIRSIRQREPDAVVVLVAEEDRLPYDRPPLSKEIIRGEVSPKEIVSEEDGFYAANNVNTLIGLKVTALELGESRHTAVLSNGDSLIFRKALLATGGVPRRLGVPGENRPGVHTLRTADDAVAIAEVARSGGSAVIIGAGFIGVELAASLAHRGMAVSVVEMASELWPTFAPPDLATVVRKRCEDEGITFHFGRKVESLEDGVVLDNGERLDASLVCVAVGIDPAIELAAAAGLTIGDGVVVNEHLQTSHPDVFAAGDIAQFPDPYFGTRRRVEHYGHAEYTGLLAGENMTGETRPYALLSYLWSDVFDLHLEAAGDPRMATRFVRRDPAGGGATVGGGAAGQPSAGVPGDAAGGSGAVGGGSGAAAEGAGGSGAAAAESASPSFILMGLSEEGRMVAYMALNRPDGELAPMQILIKKGIDLSGKEDQLADPSVQLVQLLKG